MRIENGLTQQRLADIMKIYRLKISSWENGRSTPGDIEKEQLCFILHITKIELEQTLNVGQKPNPPRPNYVSFRATDEVYRKIKENAEKANLKIGTYVALTYEGGDLVVIDGLKDFMDEQMKIGRNLNQLTKMCHVGKITAPDLKSIQSTMNDIYIKLNRLI
ncbi:MAG TPA: plasmid mobilization relaxosome protein MobC [Acetobacterium sp.]